SWHYVMMHRLRGESLAATWPHLQPDQRDRVAARLGEATAALHAVEHPALARLSPDWGDFVAAQTARCIDEQRGHGLDDARLDQTPPYLASVPLPTPRPVLLHTEIMREHLLVSEGATGWELSGLFDFEPAMLGAAEYEFASIGVFVSGGDARTLRQF